MSTSPDTYGPDAFEADREDRSARMRAAADRLYGSVRTPYCVNCGDTLRTSHGIPLCPDCRMVPCQRCDGDQMVNVGCPTDDWRYCDACDGEGVVSAAKAKKLGWKL